MNKDDENRKKKLRKKTTLAIHKNIQKECTIMKRK